jgi:hypothetical protein
VGTAWGAGATADLKGSRGRKVFVGLWQEAIGTAGFRRRLAFTAIALALVALSLVRFLLWNEARPGLTLHDPVLAMFRPVDVSWLIFLIIYGCLVAAIILLARDPFRLLQAFQGYILVLLFRITTIWLVPLEPPAAIISLEDPVVQFFGGLSSTIDKDLFFSGHAATLFLLFLYLPGFLTRSVYLLGTIAVAALLLLQHVHYTIDVVAALPFAYAAFRIAGHFNLGYIRMRR